MIGRGGYRTEGLAKKVLRHTEIDFYQISTRTGALGDPRCKPLIM
jgi:hypothetical protein